MAELKTRTGFVRARGPALACVASLLALTACGSGHATYPDGLTPETTIVPAAQATVGQSCPNLTGRYLNSGRLAPDTPQELCRSAIHSSSYRDIGDWECDVSLSSNLAGMYTTGEWLEVRQPDDDTLVVSWANPSEPLVELHRSTGEFDCAAEGLTRNLKAAMTSQGYDQGRESAGLKAYNAFAVVSMALFATGGVQTLKRTFSRASDGSLLLHVERTTRGVWLAVPVNMDYSTWVTWPLEPTTEAAPAADNLPDGPQN